MAVLVQLLVVFRLYTSLDGVKWIDEEIDGESSKCASLSNRLVLYFVRETLGFTYDPNVSISIGRHEATKASADFNNDAFKNEKVMSDCGR